ncbi:MAG: penicillin-binding protein 1C [Cyclobacteriaceae bacterium]|nr:penicillin-binding protein 1C [Cyclobacteriaceae bacterium HetDA_MAG_MS6]
MGQSIARKVKHLFKRINRWVFGSLILLALFFGLVPLPKPLFDAPYATTLLGSDGSLLGAAIADDEQWRFPPLDSIPEKFEVAILLFEDEYFFSHPGINPISIWRAIRQNIDAGEIVSGGSTLSMQTTRMVFDNMPRTYGQKLLEMATTLKMELIYDKDDILSAYANHAPFGGNIVGLAAAAYRYFGRPPEMLSWAEAATLAVLPNHPANIFPGRNDLELLEKRNRLLQKIYDRGYIDDDALILSKAEPLPQKVKPLPNMAYHLLHRAIAEGKKGQNIRTSINPKVQYLASQKVNRHSRKLTANEIHNAAALILDIKTGRTLAYIGNTNNPGTHGQHVDVITSLRSPGSLLKPFLYAAAIDEGLILPTQLLPDVPLFYDGFAPKNFDKSYRGAIPANQALASSLNVPFVHLLIEYGNEKFLQKLQQIGFRSFTQPANHYGLSLILGGAETSLWEITGVYSGLVRSFIGYTQRPLKAGYSQSDYRPNQYIQDTIMPKSKLVADGPIQAPSLHFTFQAMQQVQRPYQETGWQLFANARSISWKTGTSYGFRDGWAIGFDSGHLIGIWVGNADGEGRPGLTGVNAAAPLLFDLFELLPYADGLDEDFGQDTPVCSSSGMLAGDFCSSNRMMQLPQYMKSGTSCSYHQRLHFNKLGTHQVNSSCYEVAKMKTKNWFVLPAVQAWYYQQSHPNFEPVPPFLAGCQTATQGDMFQLIYPKKSSKVIIPIEQDGQPGKVIFEAAHQNKEAQVFWHVDKTYWGATQGTHQLGVNVSHGTHILTLVDDQGREISRQFEVVE